MGGRDCGFGFDIWLGSGNWGRGGLDDGVETRLLRVKIFDDTRDARPCRCWSGRDGSGRACWTGFRRWARTSAWGDGDALRTGSRGSQRV